MVFDEGTSRAKLIVQTNNCPAFLAGISGQELLSRLELQAGKLDIQIHRRRVDRLRRQKDVFTVQAVDLELQVRTVMLATGVVDRKPALLNIDELIRSG